MSGAHFDAAASGAQLYPVVSGAYFDAAESAADHYPVAKPSAHVCPAEHYPVAEPAAHVRPAESAADLYPVAEPAAHVGPAEPDLPAPDAHLNASLADGHTRLGSGAQTKVIVSGT